MKHGVYTEQVESSISSPKVADSGIIFAIGSAPVHTVGGKVNEPILCYSYADAVSAMGYSDDWVKYPLCEVIYTVFQQYAVAPLVLVNVLDKDKHNLVVEAEPYEELEEFSYEELEEEFYEALAAQTFEVVDNQVKLPLEVIMDTVTVEGYTVNEDFELFYEGENLILEVLESGGITESTLDISYTAVDPSLVEMGDIIGGFDTNTKKNLGLELINAVFPKFGIVPELILAPGWSHQSEVAAMMTAKAEVISGFFEGRALIDVDSDTITHYSDVAEWKKENNLFSKYQIVCYPKVKLGDRTFHLSTQIAALMSKTDSENGCPYESPSNKSLLIDSSVVGPEEETLYMGISEANYLNDLGVVTAINVMGGYVAWGNRTACNPSSTETKDNMIAVGRMFAWVASTLILSFWGKVDKPMSLRLIDNIMDSTNIWLNGLQAEEKILGGRVEFLEEENTETALMSGQMVFHVYLTPPSPAEEIRFKIEYDVDYIISALTS